MPIVDNNENIITKALTSSGDNISYILDNSNNIIIDFRRSEYISSLPSSQNQLQDV